MLSRDEDKWLEDCRERCRRIKYIAEEVEWVEKPNHSSWLIAQASLQDVNGITIPGIYFKGEYMPGTKGDKISYALMYMRGAMRCRVFMLEVYPEHVISHRESGKIVFGPHIQLGHEKLGFVARGVISNLRETLSNRWVERFRRHARIYDTDEHKLRGPFSGDIFGES